LKLNIVTADKQQTTRGGRNISQNQEALLSDFPSRVLVIAGNPPVVSAQWTNPVTKVTFAELYLHPADVDSCYQMAKDKAQSLNMCDLLTRLTICCLILWKCMETLIKILILFHS